MKKTIVTFVIILIVVAAGATAYYQYVKRSTQSKNMSMTQGNQPKPQFAAAGQLTPDFPKSLVVGAAATPTSSYAITLPNATQNTAVYETTDSMSVVYKNYLDYLQQQKYSIFNKAESANMDMIYAIGSGSLGNGDINVVITNDGSKTKVTSTFLKK